MGLDAVEIVMRTEDEFSITISDEEAETAATVGDLYRIVLAKLNVAPGCLTSRSFYRTRRALVEVLGVPRHSIRPSTRLAPLLSDQMRREQWSELGHDLGLKMPALRIPSAVRQGLYRYALFFASVPAILAFWTGLSRNWNGLAVVSLTVVLWITLLWAGFSAIEWFATPRLANELPADTAGELARVVLSLNQDTFQPAQHAGPETNEDVWRRLVEIICDQLQIERDGVVPNARFVDDLGVS